MIFSVFIIALFLIILQSKMFNYILYSPRVELNKTLYYFVSGIISAMVVLIVSDFITIDIDLFRYEILAPFIDVFYNVAIIEECSKTFLFILVYYISDKRKYSYLNIIFYMVLISLGFAFIENYMYAMSYEEPIKLLLIRSFTATLAHGCAGLLVGHGLAMMLNKEIKYGFFIFLWYLGIAIFIHGVYDYVLIYYDSIGSLILIFIMIIYTYEFILKQIKNQITPND